jgi:hypothetical protein
MAMQAMLRSLVLTAKVEKIFAYRTGFPSWKIPLLHKLLGDLKGLCRTKKTPNPVLVD